MSKEREPPPTATRNANMPKAERQIQRLVADIARHDTAVPAILAYGVAAVPALSGFLSRPAESVPHARRFAVAMLAATPGSEATVALRRVLHRHDLHALAPNLAQSERLVQNDAFAALAGRLGDEIAPEIDYGLEIARLPAAVEAVGAHAFAERIPTLIEMLADDMLAQSAQSALAGLGPAALPALLEVLQRSENDIGSLKQALAAVELLGRLPSAPLGEGLTPVLSGSHPALAAAAALTLIQTRSEAPPAKLAAALTRGALLPEAWLADRCLDALDGLPPETLVEAAAAAVAQLVAPDFYGDPHHITDLARAHLAACVLARPDADGTPLVARLPENVLLAALRQLDFVGAEATRTALEQDPRRKVREAASALLDIGAR